MEKKIILFVFVTAILLLSFPIHAIEFNKTLEPDEPGSYHIGYYKVSYNDPIYGRYIFRLYYSQNLLESVSTSIIVGLFKVKAFLTVCVNSSGFVTLIPTPPHASAYAAKSGFNRSVLNSG